MQTHVAFEHHTNPVVHTQEIPPLPEPEYTTLEEIMFGKEAVSVDEYAVQYVFATEELSDIMLRHQMLLRSQPALLLLIRRLTSMCQEAAGGNFQALKDITNSGERTLLGILDMVSELTATEELNVSNHYTELESDLRAVYDKYF